MERLGRAIQRAGRRGMTSEFIQKLIMRNRAYFIASIAFSTVAGCAAIDSRNLRGTEYLPITSPEISKLLIGHLVRPAFDTSSFRVPLLTEEFRPGGNYRAYGRGVRLTGTYDIGQNTVCVRTEGYPSHCYQFARTKDGRIFKMWRSSTMNVMQIVVE